ncbi:hypothetical protein NKG05_10845 [Oerskovia sp. M15]
MPARSEFASSRTTSSRRSTPLKVPGRHATSTRSSCGESSRRRTRSTPH